MRQMAYKGKITYKCVKLSSHGTSKCECSSNKCMNSTRHPSKSQYKMCALKSPGDIKACYSTFRTPRRIKKKKIYCKFMCGQSSSFYGHGIWSPIRIILLPTSLSINLLHYCTKWRSNRLYMYGRLLIGKRQNYIRCDILKLFHAVHL